MQALAQLLRGGGGPAAGLAALRVALPAPPLPTDPHAQAAGQDTRQSPQQQQQQQHDRRPPSGLTCGAASWTPGVRCCNFADASATPSISRSMCRQNQRLHCLAPRSLQSEFANLRPVPCPRTQPRSLWCCGGRAAMAVLQQWTRQRLLLTPICLPKVGLRSSCTGHRMARCMIWQPKVRQNPTFRLRHSARVSCLAVGLQACAVCGTGAWRLSQCQCRCLSRASLVQQ